MSFYLPRKAKDIYDVLCPVFVLSKILGIAPFTFQRTAPRCFIPNCGLMTVIRIIVVIGTMGYVAVLLNDPNAVIDIRWLALRCELYFGTFITSIVLITAITNQKLLIKAVENIIRIDYNMTKIGIRITYKNAQRFAYFQIIGITAVFSSKLVIQAFSSKEYYIFVYNVFNIVDYINTIMLFQYVNMLLLLRQRYIWLNREIKAIERCKNRLGELKLAFTRIENKNMEKMNCISLESLLNMLGKINGKLYETAKLVNRTYSVQLLSSISARFIMITTQLINTYKTIKDPNIESNNITYCLTAIYLFLHSSKIFMIASISENTAAKARDTGIYLHKLWELGDTLKDKVNFFSLQVLHQNLKFTAAGFFVLDYALMHSIVGAVTTYLIIIIQFDMSNTTH